MVEQNNLSKKNDLYFIYFLILGLVTLAFGITDLIVTITGSKYSLGVLNIPNDGFRGGWGGLVIIFSGAFYLSGLKNLHEIHQLAKLMMGSILIWIIAGTDIFAMVTESIPGGEDGGWFNTAHGFMEVYAPPYTPAVLLLPFSLLVISCIHKYYKTQEEK